MSPIFQFLGLLIVGFLIGSYLENRHYRSIKDRERKFAKTPCLSNKKVTDKLSIEQFTLASGSVVVAIDHFKKLLFGLRNLFGGEVKSYASLIDRARREALLRMKENHPTADMFINVRLETFSIGKGDQGNITSVEMFAYGTAIWLTKSSVTNENNS